MKPEAKGKVYGAQAEQDCLQDTKAAKEETTQEETNQVEQKNRLAQESPNRPCILRFVTFVAVLMHFEAVLGRGMVVLRRSALPG